MVGTQRFVTNKTNKILDALFAAGVVRGLSGAVIQEPRGRSGSAFIDITGAFTGEEEAIYDFEVLDLNPVDAPLVTEPVFTGRGSGSLVNIAYTAGPLVAQKFTVELNDLGAILRAANVDVLGNLIKARTAGTAGNTLNLKVNRSGLVFTPQSFALLSDLPINTSEIEGAEYDWNTAILSGDGTIPLTAKRITFGTDTNNVYLQYKAFEGGKTVYHFVPALQNEVPAGTVINFVTGSYTVSLYNGLVLQETYPGIVTVYDLLNAIKTSSLLLAVDTIVAYDRTPTGNASTEFQLNTDAYIRSNRGTGSTWATGFTNVTITSAAPTELIVATCFAATSKDDSTAGLGQELWRLEGSVSGVLQARVVSGETVDTAVYSITIPKKVPEGFADSKRGEFQTVGFTYVNRVDADPPAPPICPTSLTLGINAVDQNLTLTYTKRPTSGDACACDLLPGAFFDVVCLGLTTLPTGGTMGYQADTVTRLTSLYAWMAELVRDESEYFQDFDSSGQRVAFGIQDYFISNPVAQGIYTNLANYRTTPELRSLFQLVAGFESNIIPIDKLPAGAARTAGNAAWDAAVTEFKADVEGMINMTIPGVPGVPAPPTSEVVPTGAYEALAIGDAVVIFDNFGTLKVAKASNRPGVLRYGVVTANYAVNANVTVYFTGDYGTIIPGYWARFAPNFTLTYYVDALPIGAELLPSKAAPGTWNLFSNPPGNLFISDFLVNSVTGQNYAGNKVYVTVGSVAPYYVVTPDIPAIPAIPSSTNLGHALNLITDRYRSRMMQTLISAGISPLGKSDANDLNSGDGCWLNSSDTYWWLVEGSVGGGYAPAFSNVPYVSSKYQAGQIVDGVLVNQTKGYFSTKEFAFVINVKCPANLKEGDVIKLSIGNAAYPSTYQVGDKLTLEVIAPRNLELSGGANGDNIQTWNVTGEAFGPLLPYAYNPAVPVNYNSTNGLIFGFDVGAISFDKGDKFEFAVEGGHYRSRKIQSGVTGAWATFPITNTVTALDSGLSKQFKLGASPSFAVGDFYRFTALQPYALSNIKTPWFERWEWGAADPVSQLFSYPAPISLDTLAFAFHTIPITAVVNVKVSNSDATLATFDSQYNITVKPDAFALFLPAVVTGRYFKLTITGAPNAGLGWLFVGLATAFTYSAGVQLSKRYQGNKSGTDFNSTSYFKGKGTGGSVVFTRGYLTEADLQVLTDVLDYIKTNNNQAFLFSPQVTRNEAFAVKLDQDNVDIEDVHEFQGDLGEARHLSASLPLAPVYFS